LRSIDQIIQINYRYSIHFTSRLFQDENPLLLDVLHCDQALTPMKVLCVLDETLLYHHPQLSKDIQLYCMHNSACIDLCSTPIVIQGGEASKNDPKYVTMLQEAIHQYGICRHSYVMAVGGGALLDMVGYAAATAHRGVRLIRVPTTVLSQNDSGVGIKNSVNAFGKKNFLGTFAPPSVVLNDAHFLTTLPMRDWRSGIAEAVKVALLKDCLFFEFLEENAARLMDRDMQVMSKLIYRCAQLHLEHIATNGDPFESGSSRPLDFGHWAAHKLEQLSQYSLRHGEAVAIGIALDATYAYLMDLLPAHDWQRILQLFSALGLAVYANELSNYLSSPDHPDCILAGLQEFREHLGGRLTIPLITSIGHSIEVNAIDTNVMMKSIELLRQYHTIHEESIS
jgi:3-dehydroquinate synthase